MLTPEEKSRAEKLFEILLELAPADREAFIDRECRSNAAMATEVRLLLSHYEAAPPGFLQSPAADQVLDCSMETIGPYELKEVLGEGGMGVVYRAEQQTPVARTVALKVLKLGLDSREILSRFEAERQALARLEHPNIARVYDAGTTPDGRPYFVMEYVPGQAITTYCDAHRLNPRQRIELFIELCRGVQHAHQQGIIHRDLKPMNILISEQDGIAQPKVIDFGVAKAIQVDLAEATMFTQQGQLIGTPEYMSPEQAEAAPVDTRTDVYSLGAVLYELLVGVLPIDSESLRQAGFGAMMRLIREQDPQRPSTRISTLGDSSTVTARRRNVEPRVLVRALRGELDWIALKALEKDPNRRYSTVAELAADLGRHLKDEPVTARPASAWYSLRKFARRNPVGVSLALTVFVSVAILAGTMTVQANRIARERDRANHEADVSNQVKDFLVDIFYLSDPSEARGNNVTAREILDVGAQRVANLEDAAVRAELTGVLGAVYQNLGLYSKSDSLFLEAKDLWMQTEGLDSPETLRSISAVAGVFNALGRHAESESLYTVAIEGWDRLGLASDRRSLDAMSRLANALRNQRRYAEAESLLEHSLEGWRQLDGDDNIDVLRIRESLARVYYRQEKYPEAELIYEDVLGRLRRVEGDDSPLTLAVMRGLADVYRAQGRLVETEALLLEVHEVSKRIFSPSHQSYVASLESLASLYFAREDHAEALPYFRQVLESRRLIFGLEHPSTVIALHNLAAVLTEMGEYAEAEVLATETLSWRLKIQGEEHPFTQQTRQMLAVIYVQRGALEEALEQLQIAVDNGFDFPILLTEESLAVLAPLHQFPEFESLLDIVRQRIAAKGE